MKPTLDVIIPCYNAADTLAAAAASALAQADVRHVWLVDDASTDQTADIMRQLAAAHPRIQCTRLAENGGAARARNWGALQSDADFTAFLDADDTYEPNVLSPAYMALAQFSYLSLVRLKLRPVGFPQSYTGHADFKKAWQQLEMTVGGNTVFRRSVLLACGGFPQDELFRKFGGEDGALGIALTRSSVVGTLFDDNDAAVCHRYRTGIHAEHLLNAVLFDKARSDITDTDYAEAEAVTQRICNRLEEIRSHAQHPQNGIMKLHAQYA